MRVYRPLWLILVSLLVVVGGVVASLGAPQARLWILCILGISFVTAWQISEDASPGTRWADVARRTVFLAVPIWSLIGLVMIGSTTGGLLGIVTTLGAPSLITEAIRLSARSQDRRTLRRLGGIGRARHQGERRTTRMTRPAGDSGPQLRGPQDW